MTKRDHDPFFLTHDELVDSLHGVDPDLAAQAAQELARRSCRRREVVLKLRDLLSDDSPRVRTAAAEACGKIQISAAIPRLIQLLTDEYEPRGVRDTAAYALGLLGDQIALEPLRKVVLETHGSDALSVLCRCAQDASEAISKKQRIQ